MNSRARGFSLVEMMISITIGLVIIAALVGVLSGNTRSSKTNDRTSELKDNGRYALDHLKRELRHAGYRGYTPRAPESGGWITPMITNECGIAGSFVKNIRQAVWGADNNNPFSGNCIPAARYNVASDVLVIRHADGTPTPAANVIPSTIYLRSSYAGESVLQGIAVPASDMIGTENAILHVDVYYIGYDDKDATVPALRRVTLVGTAMLDEMVVSGIEQLQLEFGIADAGTTRYFAAGNIPNSNSNSHSATGATGWDNVTSVRLWLLARNARAEPGYTNTSAYEMANMNNINGNAYTVNDSFRRQLFSAVVQLRNFRNGG
jgi:type IV pilus assembly protein PilW